MTDVFIYDDHLQTFIREYKKKNGERRKKRRIKIFGDYTDTNCQSPLQEKKQKKRKLFIRLSLVHQLKCMYACGSCDIFKLAV